MNKTVFPLVMAVLTACPVLFSCTEKEQEVPVENKIYEYRFELAGDDTRAYLNDDGVFWEHNDHVGLFTPTESLEAAVNTDASPKTIDVQSSTSLAVGTKVYAYYPYVGENTSVSESKVLFPAEQSGGSISAMPLAGIPAEVVTEGEYNGVIRFLNLGSVIDFRVFSLTYAGETVESVTLQAGENSNIAGTATIDLTAVSWNDEKETATIPSLNWAEGAGSTTVTLTQSAPVAADKNAAIAGGHLYMVVAPGTYSGTITVTTNAARYTFPFTNQTFKQNGLKRFNMNLDSDSAVREAFSKTYEYVSKISEGTYLICGSESGSETNELSVALFPNVNTEGWSNDPNRQAIPHIIIGDDTSIQTITRDDAEVICSEVELIGAEGKFKIKSVKTDQYLMVPNSNYVIAFTEEESNATVFDINSNSVKSGDYYFYHSGSAHGFTFRARSATNLRFYKLGGSTLSQTLKFSETAFTYDLASEEPFEEPTLSGAKTTVEFSSEPEAIATVDDETGEVTFNANHKTGVVTIKATAIGMDGYASAEATYTITVTDSDKPVATYNKVTSADDLEVGAKYLIVFEGLSGDTDGDGDPKVFNPVLNDAGTQFAKATSSAMDVTITGGAIESSDVSDYEFTLESGYYLKADRAAKYIYPGTSGTSSVLLAESPASHALAISFNNGIAQISNGSGNNVRYIVWSTNNHYFSSNQQVSGSYSTGICLYKLDDGRQAQDISFSASAAEYDLYKSTWTVAVPDLIGAQGTVTYSSSDEAVAQVNSTGAVTIPSTAKKGDTAIITASAAGNETYKAGEASYTITIVNNAPAVSKTYNRISYATGITAGKYLIVNPADAYVFTTSTGSTNAESVTTTGGVISGDYSSYELTITKNGDNYTIQNEAGLYLYYNYSQGNQRVGYQTSVNNWTLSAGSDASDTNAFRFTSSKQNIYWNNTYFRIGGSGTTGVHLYKLSDGTTPDPGTDPDPDPTTPSYTKVTSITSGGTYLIVSHNDNLAFKGDGTTNGSSTSVTPDNGIITASSSNEFEEYEVIIKEESSGQYSIFFINLNKYLYYQNSSSGLAYGETYSQNNDFTLGTVQTGDYSGSFLFTKSSRYLYHNGTQFKIGGSGSTYGVHLYKKN